MTQQIEQTIDVYRAAMAAARADFDRDTKRLQAIHDEALLLTQKIAKTRRTITALAATCSEPGGLDSLGITDACFEVMNAATSAMSTQDVVKALEGVGFDLSGQKNAGASVHAVLGRLANKGKIEKIEIEEGGSVMWKGPNYNPDDDGIPF